ncbi:MAG: helix-turn-helix domain-containing protein [Gemmataceae bacterium]|nr:helix-turn-helix domain-containing protein [Gemmataceae bacterium]
MTTTIHRVFTTEVVRRTKPRMVTCRYFLLDSDRTLLGKFGHGKTYVCKSLATWSKVFEHSTGESTWISTTAKHTQDLLRAVSVFLAAHQGAKRVFGDLLMLQSPRVESLPAIRAIFRHVVGEVRAVRLLPSDELAEVLVAPTDEARDVFIGGLYDPATETISLTRGTFETVVVPLSLFRPSGGNAPDPNSLAVADYGHTIKLGEYEASADAILYEVDPDYRRRTNAQRRLEDKGFGPSLRRLRLQRRLKRSDFSSISPKTIARIERGETRKPHGKTLNILAARLGVEPDEIETY